MSKYCDLCNGLLEHVNISGGICTICHHVDNTRTSTKMGILSVPRPYYTEMEGNAYDVETDTWGITCTYCEDIFSVEDMNNTIDRWLCNQCYNDHVLEQ